MIPNSKYCDIIIISQHMTKLLYKQAHFKIYTKALVVFFFLSHEESANMPDRVHHTTCKQYG